MRIPTGKVFILAAALLLTASAVFPQSAPPATDYEWELQVPGRTMFRDRTPTGTVSLIKTEGKGGLFGGKGKPTGEIIAVFADVSFIPGDTARYYGIALELYGKKELLAAVMLDIDELLPLYEALDYIYGTSGNILQRERADTRIHHRGRDGWQFVFRQTGTDQTLILELPAVGGGTVSRPLTRTLLASLMDVLRRTHYELSRQGAPLEPITPNE